MMSVKNPLFVWNCSYWTLVRFITDERLSWKSQ